MWILQLVRIEVSIVDLLEMGVGISVEDGI